MKIHEKYMLRCIELGKNGLGNTAPNPMVGCVIVYNDTIIGEGFTSAYGGSHAEVNAIASVADKTLLSKASLYVTLEPCSHYGKTPPCADLISKHKIPRVIIGLKDPNPLVAGKGIAKLQSYGCDVTEGFLEDECRTHHKRFLSFQEQKRPYIILKWAESADSFIAPDNTKRTENPNPYWISNTYSKQLTHKWRAEEQGILVGTNTVLADNPALTVRNWTGKHPTRIVLDRSLRIPSNFKIFDCLTKTIVITEKKSPILKDNAHFEIADFSKPLAAQICQILYKHQINSIIVEGGAQTLQTFIDENLWDEARIFKSDHNLKTGLNAPKYLGKQIATKQITDNTLFIIQND